MALGSAVTKRGQDNSLQMCERCKYQTGWGGGEAARRVTGAGTRAGQPSRGLGTPGRLHRTAGPSPVVGRRETGCRGARFQAGVPFLGRSFAVLVLPSMSDSRPAGDLRSCVQIPPESLSAPSPPSLSRSCRARQSAGVLQLSHWTPARPSRLAPPRPSLAGRAAVAPSAVEASGAAVCGGHFVEERGAGGMQMRQTQGGERRSPEETGGRALGRGDGCLPRGRKEGVARSWVPVGRAWTPRCLCGAGGGGAMGPGAAYNHPPTATF